MTLFGVLRKSGGNDRSDCLSFLGRRTEWISSSDYLATQARNNSIQLIRYESARNCPNGRCLAVLSPQVFKSVKEPFRHQIQGWNLFIQPLDLTVWQRTLTPDRFQFYLFARWRLIAAVGAHSNRSKLTCPYISGCELAIQWLASTIRHAPKLRRAGDVLDTAVFFRPFQSIAAKAATFLPVNSVAPAWWFAAQTGQKRIKLQPEQRAPGHGAGRCTLDQR